jgi:hypothetical protein
MSLDITPWSHDFPLANAVATAAPLVTVGTYTFSSRLGIDFFDTSTGNGQRNKNHIWFEEHMAKPILHSENNLSLSA